MWIFIFLFLLVLFIYIKPLLEDFLFDLENKKNILKMKNYSTRKDFVIVEINQGKPQNGFYLYRKDLKKLFGFISYKSLIWLPIKVKEDIFEMRTYECYRADTIEEAEQISCWEDIYPLSKRNKNKSNF